MSRLPIKIIVLILSLALTGACASDTEAPDSLLPISVETPESYTLDFDVLRQTEGVTVDHELTTNPDGISEFSASWYEAESLDPDHVTENEGEISLQVKLNDQLSGGEIISCQADFRIMGQSYVSEENPDPSDNLDRKQLVAMITLGEDRILLESKGQTDNCWLVESLSTITQ